MNLTTENFNVELETKYDKWYRLTSNKYYSEKIEFKVEQIDEMIELLQQTKLMLKNA